MLIALAAFLAMGWILAFFVLHVSTIAIHTPGVWRGGEPAGALHPGPPRRPPPEGPPLGDPSEVARRGAYGRIATLCHRH